ncbi:Fur family transcriptional regulator [Asticcacaulis sp. BYS171W]|uniref:Fur family transcriptional regulator n=1 Tax=Asticcacaulis aquaticus TaxID=2984212 RepID=A0ABT5HXG6_9CAUL|nr:Fur family transcriptional regulator [Asticcacaulis aquaticus]MDC7684748.1 Fur family transcriptional regulator [Asticcacaulis aquaticus]
MSTACDHDHDHHDHHLDAHGVEARLAEARKLCEAQGERMTAPRQRTLELILSQNAPMKAYDVIDRFHPDGAAKPPTVYRALGFLEQMGLIHRIESLNAFVACQGHEHDHDHPEPHSAAFLLCECCGQSEEVMLDLGSIDRKAAASGFKVRRITLEAKGLCKACQ